MIIKTPQTDINAFLIDEVNIEIYDSINIFTDPLDFFNVLFYKFDYFNKNITDYIKIREQFTTDTTFDLFEEPENQYSIFLNKFYFFHALEKLIKHHIPTENRKGVALKSCEHIEYIVQDFNRQLKKYHSNPETHFEAIQNEIKDLQFDEKMEYLINLKHDKLQQWNDWSNDEFIGTIIKENIKNQPSNPIIKTIDIEIKRLKEIKELNIFENDLQPQQSNLKWNGSPTDFIELVKALIQNENIKGTQKEIIETFSNVFNIKIKNPDQTLTKIKTRNNGSETLFLDKLKKSLFDYITTEKKK